MNQLPKLESGMKIDQACFLELYHILINSGVITEAEAIERYQRNCKLFNWEEW